MVNPYSPPTNTKDTSRTPGSFSVLLCYIASVTCALFCPTYLLIRGFEVSVAPALAIGLVLCAICLALLMLVRSQLTHALALTLSIAMIMIMFTTYVAANSRHERNEKFHKAAERIRQMQQERQHRQDSHSAPSQSHLRVFGFTASAPALVSRNTNLHSSTRTAPL